jgi:broad specificity phosphatase PhoE
MTAHSSLAAWMRHGTCRDGERRPNAHPNPDSPLSDLGRHEVEAAAVHLRRATSGRRIHIVASPLSRAWSTAQILAARLEAELHEPEPTLTEWRPPDCVIGLTPTQYPSHYRTWRSTRGEHPDTALPGGESLSAFAARANLALDLILDLARPGQFVLAVSHRMLIGAVVALLAGQSQPAAVFNQATAVKLRPAQVVRPRIVRPSITQATELLLPARHPDWPG